MQVGQAVSQPTDLAIPVGSSLIAADGSVRGSLPETSFQSVDLRVKNAPEGTVGMMPLRGTRDWLNDRIG